MYGGTLAIDDSELNQDVNPDGLGWTYEADIAGTLTKGDDRIEIVGDFEGDFYGEDHRYAEGIVTEGSIEGSDGTAFPVGGSFIAKR